MGSRFPVVSAGRNLLDTMAGLYHFFGDRVPSGLGAVPPKPRIQTPLRRDGMALVSKVLVEQDLTASVHRSVGLVGWLGKVISRGDRVMVKPNFNSADPFPGSTDLGFLKAVVQLLRDAGAQVVVGETSGGIWRPTRRVMEKLAAMPVLREMGVKFIAFDDRPKDWVRINIGGEYLREVVMPRSAYEADRLVYLPCMKTHQVARFSLSLKLAMGFIHPGQRRGLHLRNLERKVVEINLAWQPDLIIMDGRKAFVSGGPDKGELVEPGVVMASGDIVALVAKAFQPCWWRVSALERPSHVMLTSQTCPASIGFAPTPQSKALSIHGQFGQACGTSRKGRK